MIDSKFKNNHLLSHQIEDQGRIRNNPIRPDPNNIRNNKYININQNRNNNINNIRSLSNMNNRRNNIRSNNIYNNINNNRYNNNVHENLNIKRFNSQRKHKINDFTQITIENINKLEEGNRYCSICLEDFKIREKVAVLPCIHFFHNNCIKNWIKKQNTCPICKFELTKENLYNKIKENI